MLVRCVAPPATTKKPLYLCAASHRREIIYYLPPLMPPVKKRNPCCRGVEKGSEHGASTGRDKGGREGSSFSLFSLFLSRRRRRREGHRWWVLPTDDKAERSRIFYADQLKKHSPAISGFAYFFFFFFSIFTLGAESVRACPRRISTIHALFTRLSIPRQWDNVRKLCAVTRYRPIDISRVYFWNPGAKTRHRDGKKSARSF